jgi:hypothetical protein
VAAAGAALAVTAKASAAGSQPPPGVHLNVHIADLLRDRLSMDAANTGWLLLEAQASTHDA